jgi:integrase
MPFKAKNSHRMPHDSIKDGIDSTLLTFIIVELMLEQSYGLTFFLKSQSGKSENVRYVYVRVTVDGVPRETSTKRKWEVARWDQTRERASGTKEDAKSLNYYLDTLTTSISNYKTELLRGGKKITASSIIDFLKGKDPSSLKVLEEFQKHNDRMEKLVPSEYARGTYKRFVTARSHVQEFILFKFQRDDIEFRELNYEFVQDYDFYLRSVRKCGNNTTIKYIRNLKKIVLDAVARDIIPKDPFKLYKGKIIKPKKKPLTKAELKNLENKKFENERLSTIRDIFLFQCYTGLAYIDVFQLKKHDIKEADDGRLWIMSSRQKSKSTTDIPLLPKALEIMQKYKSHPICIERDAVLPVKSNQKMNAYLKEIATLCNIDTALNTHKARRTFASTVTLNNGVPISIVKEMLGHSSVKQTEDYAMTEQETVGHEMRKLAKRLSVSSATNKAPDISDLIQKLEKELIDLKDYNKNPLDNSSNISQKLAQFEEGLNSLKAQVDH